MLALSPPSPSTLALTPALDPAGLVMLAAGVMYLLGVRRLPPPDLRHPRWPRRRTALFVLGVVVTIWLLDGGFGAYSTALFWVWTTQLLLLLLVAPVLLVLGQPVELARQLSFSPVLRFIGGPFGRFTAHPFVGPGLVPIISVVLCFGPLPGWAVQFAPLAWLVRLGVLIIGALIVLPILDVRETRSSMQVGIAMAVGFVELLIDAIPGIALRLQTHPTTTFFDHRHSYAWTPSVLHDQQNAGNVLWTVAEVLDLPFLVLVFVRWARTDSRESAQLDAVLEAERVSRSAGAEDARDQPWWLSDPSTRDRFRQ